MASSLFLIVSYHLFDFVCRYNDFTRDPISRCNCTPPYSAMHAIASRGDLNPSEGRYPFSTIGSSCFGGYDGKLLSAELLQQWRHSAISGPTNDNVATFDWTANPVCSKAAASHKGHPDKWDFSWVKVDFSRLM